MKLHNGHCNGHDSRTVALSLEHVAASKHVPEGWAWCDGCQALREDWHRHGDPLETWTWAQLLTRVRTLERVLREAGR